MLIQNWIWISARCKLICYSHSAGHGGEESDRSISRRHFTSHGLQNQLSTYLVRDESTLAAAASNFPSRTLSPLLRPASLFKDIILAASFATMKATRHHVRGQSLYSQQTLICYQIIRHRRPCRKMSCRHKRVSGSSQCCPHFRAVSAVGKASRLFCVVIKRSMYIER